MARLINSMVSGFGSQIGRRTANGLMDRRAGKASRGQWVFALSLLFAMIALIVWAIMNPVPSDVVTTTESEMVKMRIQNKIESEKEIYNSNLPKTETYNGHTVYTGPRGGKYYYSKSGRKVYI